MEEKPFNPTVFATPQQICRRFEWMKHSQLIGNNLENNEKENGNRDEWGRSRGP